jgi:hypothetical protein
MSIFKTLPNVDSTIIKLLKLLSVIAQNIAPINVVKVGLVGLPQIPRLNFQQLLITVRLVIAVHRRTQLLHIVDLVAGNNRRLFFIKNNLLFVNN